MAHMNFDKAIAHFATAHVTAKNQDQRAVADLAAGLQRLSEALHHDISQLQTTLENFEAVLARKA